MSLSKSFQGKVEREKVMKMKVVESSMVRPLSTTPTTRLWISNLDNMSLKTHYVHILYFFRPTGAANFFDAAVLKAALSRALVEFYPVAGRLELKNDCIDINCNGEGVLFVEAEADGNMDDLGDIVAPRPDVCLVPPVGRSEEISSHLAFMAQVTRFKCGGVCLGIGMEHHVSDGHSIFRFINTWADMARGRLDTIAIPPFFDRTILRARDPPQPKFPHIEYLPPPQLLKTSQQINSSDHSSSPGKIFATFKLTRSHLNALKAKCKQDDEEQGVTNYTTYEVLAAHLWCCISTARGLSENQETQMYTAVDGRSRLRPPLPSGYYGNVIFKAATVALASDLMMRSGLKFAVGKVRQALLRMDDEYLRSALDHLEVHGSVKGQVRATKLGSPNMGIVSWARLPLYDADFGWGKAAYVGLASTPPDAKVFVLPSPPNEEDYGGLVCAMTIPEEEMQLLEKLLYDI